MIKDLNVNEKGKSSRKKKEIIEEAIHRVIELNPEDKFNINSICEQVCIIMAERYTGKNLEYHSERMGMGSTGKILNAIKEYFYKDYK